MSDKQITISKNIQEYISNLKTVQNECDSISVKEKPATESVGSSADKINDACEAAKVVKKCFSNLIDCSISFFEQTGHKFESSDKTATNSIKGN